MKKGEKKRQQKALVRRTKRREAQRTARSAMASIPLFLIRQAHRYPIEGCWTQKDWQESGLAVVVIARRQPDGLLIFGDYLVDHFCLGVKDCFVRPDVPPSRFYNEYLPKMIPGRVPLEISADLAHELIYGSIEYAGQLGFRPHPDFKLAQQVLDPPDQHPRSGAVTFGKDGKPFYISGPYDNVDAIMRQLLRTAGPSNFHYLAHIGSPPEDWFEPEDEGEDEA
jgi:hypothetical protein